jgi:hypothetical protein
MSLAKNASVSKARNRSNEIVVPDKLYFRIGEVSDLCHLPAYVLRFWETEFPQLKPVKSSTGQRMYRRKDVEAVLKIKQLLFHHRRRPPAAADRSQSGKKPGAAAISQPLGQ